MQTKQRYITTKLHPNKKGFITCYKFRGIRSDCVINQEVDLSRIEDILNGSLYCSDWRKLNDVLEGKYYYEVPSSSTQKLVFETGKRLQEQKEAYRVCSLTAALTNPLMWSFYAGNNAGVAIEIKFKYPDNDIIPMTYSKTLPVLDLALAGEVDKSDVDGSWTRTIARHILTHKTNVWKHEKEVRIVVEDSKLHEHKYKISTPPVRLYYGPRMDESVYNRLHAICHSHEVEMIPIATVDEVQFGKHFDFKKG